MDCGETQASDEADLSQEEEADSHESPMDGLSMEDRSHLCGSSMVSDGVINSSCTLLIAEYPDIGGLLPPALLKVPGAVQAISDYTIQVVHVEGVMK